MRLVTVVENRGRDSAPASEASLCWSHLGSECEERIDILSLPPLASGETVTVARYIETGGQDRDAVLRVEIDPDRVTAEVDRANNVGVSQRVRTASPELQWVALEVSPTVVSGRPVSLRVTVRNGSVVASSEPVEVAIYSGSGYCRTGGGGAQHRFVLPALEPRQTVVATLRLVEPIERGCEGSAKITLVADPDGRQVWGPAHERSGERSFAVVAGPRHD